MFDAIRWQTPALSMESRAISSAISGMTAPFPKDTKKRVKAAHAEIVKPLAAELQRGAIPELVGHQRSTKYSNAEAHLLALGGQFFAVRSVDFGKGRRGIELHPPRGESLADGPFGLYPLANGEGSGLSLERSGVEAPRLFLEKEEQDVPPEYALAIWDAVTSAVTRAYRRAEAVKPAPSTSVPLGPGDPPATRSLLEVLLAPKKQALAATGDVGPLTGTDLLFAGAWRNLPVTVTSKGDGSSPVAVWIKAGEAWAPIPWPDEAKGVPHRGAGAFIDGDELHILGGLDRDGKFCAQHWVYDLRQGWNSTPRFSQAAWADNVAPALAEPMAWPLAFRYRRRTFVACGVAQFYVKEGEKQRRPLPRNKLESVERFGWQKLTDFASDMTGGSVLADDRGFFVGPGNAFDGRLELIDAEQGYARFSLPALPGRLGRGQLHKDGHKLAYTGGLVRRDDGKLEVSRAIYAYDPDGIEGWRKVGESDFGAGLSRLVRTDQGILSIMVSPGERRMYQVA